jgi:hypothetical protein
MTIEGGYAWFLARVWPDAEGTPTAWIHDWNRADGKVGPDVTKVHFSEEDSFRDVVERLYYEMVEPLLPTAHSVTATGVWIVLRKETVPVPVYVRRRETVPVYAPA